MKISVIIPTLNRASSLRHAIDSVMRQTYKDIELIVVDGLSSDGTVELLRGYAGIRWISERDRNTAEALNKGLRMASGDFVTILCSDDFFKDEGVVEAAVADLRAHPHIDLLCAGLDVTPQDSHAILYRLQSRPRGLIWGTSLYLPGAFFRRTMAADRMFDETLAVANDFDLFLYFVNVWGAKVMAVSRAHVVYRLGGLSNDVRYAFQVARECFAIRVRYYGHFVAWTFYIPALATAGVRTLGFRPQHWLRQTRLRRPPKKDNL